MVAACWNLWRERNSQIFRDTSYYIKECLSIIIFDAYDWQCAHSDGYIHRKVRDKFDTTRSPINSKYDTLFGPWGGYGDLIHDQTFVVRVILVQMIAFGLFYIILWLVLCIILLGAMLCLIYVFIPFLGFLCAMKFGLVLLSSFNGTEGSYLTDLVQKKNVHYQ